MMFVIPEIACKDSAFFCSTKKNETFFSCVGHFCSVVCFFDYVCMGRWGCLKYNYGIILKNMGDIIAGRLEALRTKMRDSGVSATVIPQSDPHQSEYLASHWQARRYFSGFTGSAGTLVVTMSDAMLWTDSRYFIQASSQLSGSGIGLMKDGLPGTPSINAWLAANMVRGGVVGVDGWLVSAEAARSMESALAQYDLKLDMGFDPVDGLWADRPALPKGEIFVHELKYAGESACEKIGRIREALAGRMVRSVFISALDEIAWTLNIRACDVKCNPVATAFLYVGLTECVLFVDGDKLTADVSAHLAEAGVRTRGYDGVADFLAGLPGDERVLIDAGKTAAVVARMLGDRVVEGECPVAMMKARKNAVQIDGFRHAMVRDGVALTEAFAEIDRRMREGVLTTELDVADILREKRSAQDLFFDESFDTIAGHGPNGAIVHYSATEETNAELKRGNLLLVDSGAQYLDGTTDITRTISLGDATALQKRDFTLVLKGMIALDMAVFPAGTRGVQLDVLAHQYVWRGQNNYLHGTGHGVGHFLNVHEGPQTIRNNNNMTPIAEGMVTSDEPGLYREGVHGVRCENLILTVKASPVAHGDGTPFLKFETLTLFPFDTTLIDMDLFTAEERVWLNGYHERVKAAIMPHLNDDMSRQWLEKATKAI